MLKSGAHEFEALGLLAWHLYSMVFYTRKYTFLEARGTRSCIRLHGMGVLVFGNIQYPVLRGAGPWYLVTL